MLDTGIDVPEVVNLVFFKLVRSKTKFWQMIGRGTRLRPGPVRPRETTSRSFNVFDFCQNLEFFSQDAPTVEGSVGDSIGARLFKTRLDLLGALDGRGPDRPEAETVLRTDIAELLRADVAAMNPENFLVRPRRRLVEAYAKPEAWAMLDEDARRQLADELAGLPTQRPPDSLEAKQFDLLVLTLQLCLLGAGTGFPKLRERLVEIAAALEEQVSIPVVAAQMTLIQEVQTDTWWQDVTVSLLEIVPQAAARPGAPDREAPPRADLHRFYG